MIGGGLTECEQIAGGGFGGESVGGKVGEAIGFERCRDLEGNTGLKINSWGGSSDFWFEVKERLGINLLVLCGSNLEGEAAFDGAIVLPRKIEENDGKGQVGLWLLPYS